MKADFRFSQRSNISNRLSANSAMKMSRAHDKIVRLMSHENMHLSGFAGRASAQSHFAQRDEIHPQAPEENGSRPRVISHDFGGQHQK